MSQPNRDARRTARLRREQFLAANEAQTARVRSEGYRYEAPKPVPSSPPSASVAAITVASGLVRWARAVAWMVIGATVLLPFWLLVWWLA